MKAFLLLTVAVASGCVALPNDRDALHVQSLLRDRSGSADHVRWKLDKEACAELAKANPDKALGPDQAVGIALSCSPRMRTVYSGLAVTQAEVYEATRVLNPRIDLVRLSTGAPANVVETAWSVSQRFLELLLLPARQRMGKQQLLISQQQAAQAVLNLERDVRAAFVVYAAAKSIADMQQKAAQAATLSARTAAAFHEAGNVSELQLSRERASAIEADLESVRARSEAVKARASLLTSMGVASGTETAAKFAFDTELPLPLPLRDDPAALLKAAGNRLDLLAARERVQVIGRDAVRRKRWRGIDDLELGYEREHETGVQTKSGPRASLTLPIAGLKSGRTLRAQANVEFAESELAALEVAMTNESWSSLHAAIAAHAATKALREQLVPLRARITELTQREFNYMFIGAFELLAVKREELRAYRLYLEAVRDEWLAHFDVQRVAGGKLPPALLTSESEGVQP
jgi:outer membrane protein, heavy metal efflux system